jgi:hypothetical protein
MVSETSDHGYPIREHLARVIDGEIIWAPAIDGAFLLSPAAATSSCASARTCRSATSRHDAETVQLYFQESLTFLVYTTEASVALTATAHRPPGSDGFRASLAGVSVVARGHGRVTRKGDAMYPTDPSPPDQPDQRRLEHGGAVRRLRRGQRAVDRLSDDGFPVEKLDIIGTDLRTIERVTGRLTTARAAGAGAISGLWVGLFVRAPARPVHQRNAWFAVILVGAALGAAWGAIFGAVAHAATRGQRDFSSVRTLAASHYDLVARTVPVDQAKNMLRQAGLLPDTVLDAGSSEPVRHYQQRGYSYRVGGNGWCSLMWPSSPLSSSRLNSARSSCQSSFCVMSSGCGGVRWPAAPRPGRRRRARRRPALPR